MKYYTLKVRDITELEKNALLNGNLITKAAEFYEQFDQETISQFCVKYGIYCLPTIELIDWLKKEINSKRTIEVGAGNGCLGRSLQIKMTDSYQQTKPEVVLLYQILKQTPVKYGKDVKKINGLSAVKKYKPKVVVATWITNRWDHSMEYGNIDGIDETKLISKVKKYIHIGNIDTHGTKKALRKPHKKYQFPWLYSRSMNKKGNIIYVWDNKIQF